MGPHPSEWIKKISVWINEEKTHKKADTTQAHPCEVSAFP
jgi:hypothetical protein